MQEYPPVCRGGRTQRFGRTAACQTESSKEPLFGAQRAAGGPSEVAERGADGWGRWMGSVPGAHRFQWARPTRSIAGKRGIGRPAASKPAGVRASGRVLGAEQRRASRSEIGSSPTPSAPNNRCRMRRCDLGGSQTVRGLAERCEESLSEIRIAPPGRSPCAPCRGWARRSGIGRQAHPAPRAPSPSPWRAPRRR